LGVILSFVGVKMVVAELYEIPIAISLLFIAGVLAIAVVASLLRARRLGLDVMAVAGALRAED
jgi:tellurite resistance protein TerC